MPDTDTSPRSPSLVWSGVSDKPSYYKLFFAYVIALLATGIATVALALFAFDLAGDGSATVLGTALSIKMFAYVIAAPISAALTERLPRKSLLITLDLLRAASLLLLPFVSQIWQVYGLVFVFALASATFTLVYLSVVPYLLGSAGDYAQSLARSRIAAEADGAASPLLAAGLLLLVSATGVFVIATLAFLISAAMVRAADLPRTLAVHPDGIWQKVFRGPRLFFARPEFRSVIALDIAVALATAMVMVNTVVIIQGRLDLDRESAVLAFFAFGLGSVLGAIAMPLLLRRIMDRSLMLGGATVMSAALLLGPVLSTYAGMLLLWTVLGAGVALALTPAIFLIRRIAAPADLQTLFAAQFSIANACLLVAYSVAGWTGALLGMQYAFLLLGAGAGLATFAATRLWPADVDT